MDRASVPKCRLNKDAVPTIHSKPLDQHPSPIEDIAKSPPKKKERLGAFQKRELARIVDENTPKTEEKRGNCDEQTEMELQTDYQNKVIMAFVDKETYPVLVYVNKQQECLIRTIFQMNQWTLVMKVLTESEKEMLISPKVNLEDNSAPSLRDVVDTKIELNTRYEQNASESTQKHVEPFHKYDYNEEVTSSKEVSDNERQPKGLEKVDVGPGCSKTSSSVKPQEDGYKATGDVLMITKNEDFDDSYNEMSVDETQTTCADIKYSWNYGIDEKIVIKTEVMDSETDTNLKDVNTSDLSGIRNNQSAVKSETDTASESFHVKLSETHNRAASSCEIDLDYTVVKNEVTADPEYGIEAKNHSIDVKQFTIMGEKSSESDNKMSIKEPNQLDIDDNSTMARETVPPAKENISNPLQQNSVIAEQIDLVIKYLGDCMSNKPSLSGHLIKTCCVFLFEKDKEFPKWCKNFVHLTTGSASEPRVCRESILTMASNSHKGLVQEVLKRLAKIAKNSQDSNFLNYFYKFLTSCKVLMMEALGSAPRIPVIYLVPNNAASSQTPTSTSTPNNVSTQLTSLPILAVPQNTPTLSNVNSQEVQNKTVIMQGLPGHSSIIAQTQSTTPPRITLPRLRRIVPKISLETNISTPTLNSLSNTNKSQKSPEQPKVLCLHCPKKFSCQKYLDFHMTRCHPQLADVIECYTCKERFRYNQDLIWHRQATKHKVYKPCTCNICGKELASKIYLPIHMKCVHGTKDKPYKSEISSKAFKHKPSLNDHRQLVHSTEGWKCDICDRTFKNKQFSYAHRLRHVEANKNVECPDCGKMFFQKALMARHRRIHTGEKPFKCTLCDYRNVFKYNVTNHLKTHHKRASTEIRDT